MSAGPKWLKIYFEGREDMAQMVFCEPLGRPPLASLADVRAELECDGLSDVELGAFVFVYDGGPIGRKQEAGIPLTVLADNVIVLRPVSAKETPARTPVGHLPPSTTTTAVALPLPTQAPALIAQWRPTGRKRAQAPPGTGPPVIEGAPPPLSSRKKARKALEQGIFKKCSFCNQVARAHNLEFLNFPMVPCQECTVAVESDAECPIKYSSAVHDWYSKSDRKKCKARVAPARIFDELNKCLQRTRANLFQMEQLPAPIP